MLFSVRVPQGDKAIGRTIIISRGNVLALEDEGSDLAGSHSLLRFFLPGFVAEPFDRTILSDVVNRQFHLKHASLVIFLNCSYCFVSFQDNPLESWIWVLKVLHISFPVADS